MIVAKNPRPFAAVALAVFAMLALLMTPVGKAGAGQGGLQDEAARALDGAVDIHVQQAFNAPAKPRKARDLVSITDAMQGPLTDICRMYPADCQFNADGSVARVAGRRIVPGTDRAVLRHFQIEIGAIQDASWGQQ